jgi:hypothetical protein
VPFLASKAVLALRAVLEARWKMIHPRDCTSSVCSECGKALWHDEAVLRFDRWMHIECFEQLDAFFWILSNQSICRQGEAERREAFLRRRQVRGGGGQ